MAAETNKRYEGTVKWFNGRKGFGFIAPAADDTTTTTGDNDLFVHQSEIKAEGFRFLRDGEKVEFSIDTGEDGRKKAVDVVGFGRMTRGVIRRRGRGRRGGYRGGGGGGGFGGEAVDGHGGRGGMFSGGGRVGTRPECYNCGRVGHFARDCYRGTGGGGDDQRYDSGRGGGRGDRSRACYRCGEEGHFARECPNDQD